MIARCPEQGCDAELGVRPGWAIQHEPDGSHTAKQDPPESEDQ